MSACTVAFCLSLGAIVLSTLSGVMAIRARRSYRQAVLDVIEAHANKCGKGRDVTGNT